jgi:hypothetical protein
MSTQVLPRCLPNLLQFLSSKIVRALRWSSNAAPRQACIKHPVLRSFTRGTISGKRTPGGLDKNTRDTFRDHIGLRATFSYVLSAWIPHVGSSLQSGFFGRCDAHGRDSSPHAGDCKRTPPPPPSLQYRRRQGTQGQRQVEAGGSGVATTRARRTTPSSFLA